VSGRDARPVRSAYQPPANSTFFHNKPATSNQPVVLFSQNKPAPAISHQPTDQAESLITVRSREELDPRDPTPTCPLTLDPHVSLASQYEQLERPRLSSAHAERCDPVALSEQNTPVTFHTATAA
jgi:hypothetical protein